MDCGTSLVKYILFVFNTIVSIIGVLAIVYGALILKNVGTLEVNGQTGFPPEALMPLILITIGSIVVLISFLGCCGAIRESVCMTMSYAVCMLILLIVQATIVVMLWTNKDKITDAMGEVIDKAWERESRESGIFDALQQSLHCCGKNSFLDYGLILKTPPPSCCANNDCSTLQFYDGCRKKFVEFMSGSTQTSQYVGLGLIIVELVGFIFACCLANNVRNYKRRNAY